PDLRHQTPFPTRRSSDLSQIIDVTIHGTNDAASISGTATGSATEDGTLTASGALTVSDVDTGENHFQTPASLAGAYGSFAFNAAARESTRLHASRVANSH